MLQYTIVYDYSITLNNLSHRLYCDFCETVMSITFTSM